jgi:hypothetical protein
MIFVLSVIALELSSRSAFEIRISVNFPLAIHSPRSSDRAVRPPTTPLSAPSPPPFRERFTHPLPSRIRTSVPNRINIGDF